MIVKFIQKELHVSQDADNNESLRLSPKQDSYTTPFMAQGSLWKSA